MPVQLQRGNEGVDRILKRYAFCWLTSSSSLEREPQRPVSAEASVRCGCASADGQRADRSAQRCSALPQPHLTIATADHDAASPGASSRLYSLSDRSASVELKLPARFDQVGLGATVWSSAVGLSIWLSHAASTGQLRIAGARLLELGAGVGLPGLLCGQLGADAPSQVTLTDLSTQLVDCMQANAERNAKDGAPAPKVAVLNWDDRSADLDCDEYDIIVGADLVYNPAHVTQLVQTVLPRLATGLSTLVLVEPGMYTDAEFDTRNGWAELKVALAAVGTVERRRMQLALLEHRATSGSTELTSGSTELWTRGAATHNAGGDREGGAGTDTHRLETGEVGQSAHPSSLEPMAYADLELLIFRKEVLCLMPPLAQPE